MILGNFIHDGTRDFSDVYTPVCLIEFLHYHNVNMHSLIERATLAQVKPSAGGEEA